MIILFIVFGAIVLMRWFASGGSTTRGSNLEQGDSYWSNPASSFLYDGCTYRSDCSDVSDLWEGFDGGDDFGGGDSGASGDF